MTKNSSILNAKFPRYLFSWYPTAWNPTFSVIPTSSSFSLVIYFGNSVLSIFQNARVMDRAYSTSSKALNIEGIAVTTYVVKIITRGIQMDGPLI